jgi:hypothetical protein
MRAETDVPPSERVLTIVGRLDGSLIRDLDERIIPKFISDLKRRVPAQPGAGRQAAIDQYFNRDKSRDDAYATLYAYADVERGRNYNQLFPRDSAHQAMMVDCSVALILFEAWIPAPSIEHGHKHILFLRFKSGAPSCIPTYGTWEDISKSQRAYGLRQAQDDGIVKAAF